MTQLTKSRILYSLISILVAWCMAWTAGGTFSTGAGGGGEASCDGCNTSNDAVIAQDALTAASNTSNAGIWLAWSFTTTGTKCITGGYFGCGGKNMDATFEIYTNNAGSPGSRVGDGYTKFKTDIPDLISDLDFIFDAVQTLPAGTYWIVWKADATNKPSYGYGETNTGWKYSTNSGSSWANSSYNMRAGVYGCDPS